MPVIIIVALGVLGVLVGAVVLAAIFRKHHNDNTL